ncbi:hypothetical protein G9A89_023835 [Geosiphon pyriformis]|nr:hypothetical protein G9A89_023835 [Geosiphon pyriformis]
MPLRLQSPPPPPDFGTADLWEVTESEKEEKKEKDTTSHKLKIKQKQPFTNNILSAIIIEDKSLAAIFPFEFKKPVEMLLFSKATLELKPITAIYTNAKIDEQYIKLILDSRLAGSIITRQLMNQLDHQVDQAASTRIITANEATKTPIGKIDNLLIKVNSIIIPIKTTNTLAPLIEFEEEEKKPIWKTYQVLWAENDYNELPPIPFWDNNRKRKQKEKLT